MHNKRVYTDNSTLIYIYMHNKRVYTHKYCQYYIPDGARFVLNNKLQPYPVINLF